MWPKIIAPKACQRLQLKRGERIWTQREAVLIESDQEKERDEDKPPEDERESCFMCGTCEVRGEGCIVHAAWGEIEIGSSPRARIDRP